MAAPPQAAVVLHMAAPIGKERPILPRLWAETTEAQLDGKPYRQAKGPMGVSIFQPDDRTLILGTDDILRRMVANHAKPEAGNVSRVLGRMPELPDALALLLVEPVRPLAAPMLAAAPLPPPLAGVKKVPELLFSIGAKANLTGDMSMSLNLRAVDEEAAKQLEEIIDQGLNMAREMMRAQMQAERAKQAQSDDPVQQAMAKYMERVSDRMLQAWRPARKGNSLVLASSGNQSQMATIGVLIALLLLDLIPKETLFLLTGKDLIQC